MLRHGTLLVVLGFAVVACGRSSPTAPVPAAPGASTAIGSSPCGLALHAILREAGTARVVGQIQFRIEPAAEGSADATVSYAGVFAAMGLDYTTLAASLLPRVPDQAPTWTDVQKSDPGTTLSEVLHFSGFASMSNELVLALVDDPARYKAVVQAEASSGGREAEGLVAPTRNVPETLRDRQRTCFGAE